MLEDLDPCPECGAPLRLGPYLKRTRVGSYIVEDDSRSMPVCAGGHVAELAIPELVEFERRAAAVVLTENVELEGEEIRFARKSLGLTVARFAAMLEVPLETVSRWEGGAETMPSVARLALAGALDRAMIERPATDPPARVGDVLRVRPRGAQRPFSA